jgi:endonuclease-3 related protein
MRDRLLRIFELLLERFGPRHWWPGETPLEVMVGAILTQNTAWRNVERAIHNMKAADLMDITRIYEFGEKELADIIRPSGFFNIKSRRLKTFIAFLVDEYGGRIEGLESVPQETLRHQFLSLSGIGPETADSILLYALDRPVFVVDAYTKRFLRQHGISDGEQNYHEVQGFFTSNLPSDSALFNEYHALIVRLCQTHCRKAPQCEGCPLEEDRERAAGPPNL